MNIKKNNKKKKLQAYWMNGGTEPKSLQLPAQHEWKKTILKENNIETIKKKNWNLKHKKEKASLSHVDKSVRTVGHDTTPPPVRRLIFGLKDKNEIIILEIKYKMKFAASFI